MFGEPAPPPVTLVADPVAVPPGGTLTVTADQLPSGSEAAFVVCRPDGKASADCGAPTPGVSADPDGRASASAHRRRRPVSAGIHLRRGGGRRRRRTACLRPLRIIGRSGAAYDDPRLRAGLVVAALLLGIAFVLLRRTDWTPVGGRSLRRGGDPQRPLRRRPRSMSSARWPRAPGCDTMARMDLTYPPEAEEFRTEIRAWLEENLPDGWFDDGLRDDARRSGRRSTRRGRPSSTTAAGSAPPGRRSTAARACRSCRAWCWPRSSPGPRRRCGPTSSATPSSGPTILQWGTEEQKQEFLPQIMQGKVRWCQGFSEPDSGLRPGVPEDERGARRQRVGDQRPEGVDHPGPVRRLLLPARPHRPGRRQARRHLLPARADAASPGVEVRPITQPDGTAEFNEVFFADARCPADNVVGGLNNGWAVTNTTLGFERGQSATTGYRRFQEEWNARWWPRRRANGAIDDPVIRQRLARYYTKVQIIRINGLRTLTATLHRPQGPVDRRARRHQQDDVVGDAQGGHGAGPRHLRRRARCSRTSGRRPDRGPPPCAARARAATRSARWCRRSSSAAPRRSGAAPRRSSATSWASGCSASRRSRRPRRADGRVRPRRIGVGVDAAVGPSPPHRVGRPPGPYQAMSSRPSPSKSPATGR